MLAQPLGLAAMKKYACLAEELGYTRIWLAETAGPDALVACAVLGQATSKIKLGTAIVSSYTRSAASLAMAAATIAESSQRQFVLGVGAGGDQIVSKWHGCEYKAPLSHTRDTLQLIRQMLTGQRSDFESASVRSSGFQLNAEEGFRKDVKLYLGVLGPKMLRLASEIADGVILTFVSPEMLKDKISEIHNAAIGAGRRPEDVKIVVRIATAVTGDLDSARETFRQMLCFYLGSPAYRRHFSLLGYHDEVQRFEKAVETRDRERMRAAISESMVDGLFIAGDSRYCCETIDQMYLAGVDEMVINPLFELGVSVVEDTYRACAASPKMQA